MPDTPNVDVDHALTLLRVSFAGHPAERPANELADALEANRPVLDALKGLIGKLVSNPKAIAALVAFILGFIPGAAPIAGPLADLIAALAGGLPTPGPNPIPAVGSAASEGPIQP